MFDIIVSICLIIMYIGLILTHLTIGCSIAIWFFSPGTTVENFKFIAFVWLWPLMIPVIIYKFIILMFNKE